MKLRTTAALAVIFSAAISANSQMDPGRPTQNDIVRQNLEQRMNNMRNLDALARKTAQERKAAYAAPSLRPELTEELTADLEVDEGIRSEYAGFLSLPGTGILRLISTKDCREIRKDNKRLECYQRNTNVKEFANAYSFREGTHSVFAKSDIVLYDKMIGTGLHSVQTILVSLGDVAIDELGLDSPGVSYLARFDPANGISEVDTQYAELKNGITVAEFVGGKLGPSLTYSKLSDARAGTSYAVRAVAYRPSGVDPIAKDRDVIVVFRILEMDDEGNVTIIWKELARETGRVMDARRAAPVQEQDGT